jgi:hypothetical protein
MPFSTDKIRMDQNKDRKVHTSYKKDIEDHDFTSYHKDPPCVTYYVLTCKWLILQHFTHPTVTPTLALLPVYTHLS